MTLLGFCNSLPELSGRVYLDTAPAVPATPYAIVYDAPGGIQQPFYGGSDMTAVYPSVTVYHKPVTGGSAQQARLELMAIMTKLQQAHRSVDTHSDGVTPYAPGSVQRASEFSPMPDKAVQGQLYATVRFVAFIYRG